MRAVTRPLLCLTALLAYLFCALLGPALHAYIGDGCCDTVAGACDASHDHHACCHHHHAGHVHDEDSPQPEPREPHDPESCSICQWVAQARLAVAIVEFPAPREVARRVEAMISLQFGDPQPFNLLCRGPPRRLLTTA